MAARVGIRFVRASVGASAPSDLWRAVVIQNEAEIAAGFLTAYDGRRPFDHGFACAAWVDSNQFTTAATGGHLEAGTRLWGGHSEYRDALGIVHRGPTMITASLGTSGGSSTVTLPVVSPPMSPKAPSSNANAVGESLLVTFSVYRTVVGGAVLYKLGLEPLINTLVPAFTSSPDSFLDTVSDAGILGTTGPALSSRPPIYTNSGELDDYQPPGFTTLTTYRNRLFGVSGDQRTIWVSKDYSANAGTAPGFHPTQILLVADNVVSLLSLDEKFVIIGSNTIHYVVGDGPAPNGQGSDYGEPVRVTVELGCTNARSVVSAPPGIFYQSIRGLELLDRQLNPHWIGRAIRDDLAAYPNITSAVHVVDQHEVRFTCNNAGGTNGIVLAFDYENNAWFTRSYTDASDTGTAGVAFADACYASGVYTLLTPGGQVYQENKTTYLDAGTTWVGRDVQIAWVSPAGKMSWQRCKEWQVNGTVVSNHDLVVSVATDYSSSWDTVTTFPAGGEGTVGPLQRIRKICKRQKVQATRLRLQDNTPSNPGSYPVGTGAGPIWEGLGLYVSQKAGLPRTPSVEQG